MTDDNVDMQVTGSTVSEEIKGWNWGAFFLHWIWAIGNKSWIGLLTFIVPFFPIFLGIKGNELAWKNRQWQSVDQFKAVQRTWAIVGLVLFLLQIPGVFVSCAILYPVFARARMKADEINYRSKMEAHGVLPGGQMPGMNGQTVNPMQVPGVSVKPTGTATGPGAPKVPGKPVAAAVNAGHPGGAMVKGAGAAAGKAMAMKPGVPGQPNAMAKTPGVPGGAKAVAAKGGPVGVKPAVGGPNRLGGRQAVSTDPAAPVPLDVVLPQGAKTVIEKNWDGTKSEFLKFKFQPNASRKIIVKLPAEYRQQKLTRGGWNAMFQAFGIDQEMKFQVAEDKMAEDLNEMSIRAMLGAGQKGMGGRDGSPGGGVSSLPALGSTASVGVAPGRGSMMGGGMSGRGSR